MLWVIQEPLDSTREFTACSHCRVDLRSDRTTFVNSGLNMIAFIMIFFFVRETRKKTLEDLDGVCNVPEINRTKRS